MSLPPNKNIISFFAYFLPDSPNDPYKAGISPHFTDEYTEVREIKLLNSYSCKVQTQVCLIPKIMHPCHTAQKQKQRAGFPSPSLAVSAPATQLKPAAVCPLLLSVSSRQRLKEACYLFQLIDLLPEPALGANAHMAQLPHAQRPAHQPLVTSGTYFKLPLTTTAK